MAEMHERMRDVLLPMFHEHQVPIPFAIWDTQEPGGTSLLTWMLTWEDYDHRQSTWARFKPLFEVERRARTADEFVTQTDLTLIEPWPSLSLTFPAGPDACEVAWHVQTRIGHTLAFRAACLDTNFAMFTDCGATSVVASDLVFGPLPRSFLLVSWPDKSSRDKGMDVIAGIKAAPEISAAVGAENDITGSGIWQRLDRAPYLDRW